MTTADAYAFVGWSFPVIFVTTAFPYHTPVIHPYIIHPLPLPLTVGR